jgi:UDP-2,3-diacylglucosamine pyrophosphatase LpxH
MLVVISDLHLVDNTGGGRNLPKEAFREVFFCDIKSLAQDNNATEIKIVLLGDTIDLLRTAKWFDVAREDRPWGRNGLEDLNQDNRAAKNAGEERKSSKTEDVCLEILQKIIDENRPIFGFFRNIKYCFGPLISKEKVELIYVPGNHDRLINCYPSLKKKIVEVLDPTINETTVEGDYKNGGDWSFRECYISEKYGILARHGHQFDRWNYEGSCYQVPIGDVITTEIAARIPYEFKKEIKAKLRQIGFASPQERDDVDKEIEALTEEIDNIRPWSSLIPYLWRKSFTFSKFGKHGRNYLLILHKAIWRAVFSFFMIRFTWKWQFHLRSVRTILSGLWGALCQISQTLQKTIPDPCRDPFAKDAQSDCNTSNFKTPFILYGHTHSPAEIPLNRDPDRTDPDSIYVNTGTWRPRIIRTADRKEYTTLKTMTYVVFYGPKEDSWHRKPGTRSFDVWTGWESKQLDDKHVRY